MSQQGFAGFSAFASNKSEQRGKKSGWNKSVESQWNDPQRFIDEHSKTMERITDEDPFEKYKTKTISERENDYTSKWRTAQLSPERVDPFAKSVSEQEKKTKRTYNDIYEENKLDREKKQLLFQMNKKYLSGNISSRSSSSQDRYNDDRRVDEKIEEKTGQDDQTIKVNVGISFELSGVLAKQTNTVNQKGTVLKWQSPPECKLPAVKWVMFTMKNGETTGNPTELFKQKAWLFGRDQDVVDVILHNLSCSKQHAVLCFRNTEIGTDNRARYTGQRNLEIKPYIIDLQSTNGTFINGERIDDSRYYELKEFDLIKFGQSTTEYMILNDKSKI